ncbi:hypothetical protein BH09BAC1_BH09BAC1_02490 [soil metagenome]
MKRIIILSFIIAVYTALVAQSANVQIKWGDLGKEKFFAPDVDFEVIGATSSSIYVKKFLGGKSSYFMYDRSLKLIKEIPIDKAFAGWSREIAPGACYFYDDYCLQVYFENNFKEDGSVPTYLAELDVNTMKHKQKEEVGKRYPNTNYQWNFMGYYVRQSADKTKFMFLANDREYKMLNMKNSVADYQVIVYNSKLNKIQESKWNYTGSCDRLDVESAIVDNDGNVFVLSKVNSKDLKKSTGKGYLYVLVALPLNGPATHQTFEEGENNIGYFELVSSGKGKLQMAGMYSLKRSPSSSIGTFFCNFNAATGKVEALKFTPYNDELKTKLVRARAKEELDDVILLGVEAIPGGGAVVLTEQTFSPPDNSGNASYTQHLDIIITRYDEYGKVVWQKNIPKQQRAPTMGTFSSKYYSYFYTFDSEKIRIMFNDDIKNLDNYDGSKTVMCRGFNDATAMFVDMKVSDGSYKKYPVFKATEANVLLYPGASHALSPNRVIIFAGDITGSKIVSFRIGEVTMN